MGSVTKYSGMPTGNPMVGEITRMELTRKKYCMRGERLELWMMIGGEPKGGGMILQVIPEMGLRVLVRILFMGKGGMLILRIWVTTGSILNG